MSRERKNDEMSFEERRRNGEMICISCGQFSSITTCYHCGLILSGLHPAAKFIAKTAAIDAVRDNYNDLKNAYDKYNFNEPCALVTMSANDCRMEIRKLLKILMNNIESRWPEVKDGT